MKLALGLMLLAAGSAWAQEKIPDETPATESSLSSLGVSGLDISGALRFDYFSSSRTLDDRRDFPGGTVQAKIQPAWNDALRGKLEGRITQPKLGSGTAGSTLLESWLALRTGTSEWRLGKQIVPWGRADGINPTDNLTPRDFTVLLPFEEDQRLGLTAFKLDYYLTEQHTLTFFTTPEFTPSTLPRPMDGTQIVETRPGSALGDSTVALKINKTGDDLDWSASYFRGYSHLPQATPIGISGGLPILQWHYDKIEVWGADFAKNFGRWGVRGEVAYYMTQDKNGSDPAVKNPFLFYVLGADRTFFDNLNVNLQFIGRRVRNYHDPAAISDPLARGVAVQNAITGGQQDRESYGLSTRISDKWWNDTLEAEVLMLGYLTRPSYYLRPLVSYALDDHVKGTLGGEIYSGADDTFYGQLKRNRNIFVELRYSF